MLNNQNIIFSLCIFAICSPLFEVKCLISELTTFKWKQSKYKTMEKPINGFCLKGTGWLFWSGPGRDNKSRCSTEWGRHRGQKRQQYRAEVPRCSPRKPVWLDRPGPWEEGSGALSMWQESGGLVAKLFLTLVTMDVATRLPLSMEFSRQMLWWLYFFSKDLLRVDPRPSALWTGGLAWFFQL